MNLFLTTMVSCAVVFAGGWAWGRWQRPHPVFIAQRVVEEGGAAASRTIGTPLMAETIQSVGARSLTSASGLSWRPNTVESEAFSERVRAATPDALSQIAASLGDPPVPPWAAEELVRLWAEQDPESARQYFEQLPPRSRFALMGRLVAGWAPHDPDGAIAWLATQPANSAALDARSIAMGELAKIDPDRALSTLRAHGWIQDSPAALREAFRVWIESDPADAMANWREVNHELNPPEYPDRSAPVPPFTDELIASALSAGGAQGPTEFLRFIDLFTADELAAGASKWIHIPLTHDPTIVFPALEAKVPTATMIQLVERAVSRNPDQAEMLAGLLRAPELTRLCQPRDELLDRWPEVSDVFPQDQPVFDP